MNRADTRIHGHTNLLTNIYLPVMILVELVFKYRCNKNLDGLKYVKLSRKSMISGAQIRAARALLGMSGTELSELAKVGWSTVQRFESVDGIPSSKAGTLERIRLTLEAAGITFTGDPVASPGVQLTRPPKSGVLRR